MEPALVLRLFEFVARHGLRLAPDTIERLQGFTPQAKWEDWKRLLSLPKASLGLRAMQEAGVMPNALPEWRNIECLVVRDFYHRYTVDEHSIVAIETIDTLAAEKDGPAARFHDLLLEEDDLELKHDAAGGEDYFQYHGWVVAF